MYHRICLRNACRHRSIVKLPLLCPLMRYNRKCLRIVGPELRTSYPRFVLDKLVHGFVASISGKLSGNLCEKLSVNIILIQTWGCLAIDTSWSMTHTGWEVKSRVRSRRLHKSSPWNIFIDGSPIFTVISVMLYRSLEPCTSCLTSSWVFGLCDGHICRIQPVR